jgi:hypothetical protein
MGPRIKCYLSLEEDCDLFADVASFLSGEFDPHPLLVQDILMSA